MIPPSRDPRLVERENKIRKKRKELHEQCVDWIIRRTKSHTIYPLEILAAVQEEQALKRMQKHAYNITENYNTQRSAELFWVNQKRFLEFTDPKNPEMVAESQNTGYIHSLSHFLDKNPDYRDNLLGLTESERVKLRQNYWKEYNVLVQDIHARIPKYVSIDSILIPI